MTEQKRRGRPPKTEKVQPVDLSPSQAYANRVWAGQSESLGRAERIRRCLAALDGQGLPRDGVTFEDAEE